MAREIDNGSIVVDEGDIVIVSKTEKKKDGVFAKVKIRTFTKGDDADVELKPIMGDETKHAYLAGKLLPNLSPQKSVLLVGEYRKFKAGKDATVSVANKLDLVRYFVAQKILKW